MSVYKAVLLLSFTAVHFLCETDTSLRTLNLILIHSGFCVIIVAVIKIKVKSARHYGISSISARHGNK